MKKQIRYGVFETNSSSVHSLAIANEMPDMSKYSGRTFNIKHGEFGWESEVYYHPSEKASYLYECIEACSDDVESDKTKLEEVLNSYGIFATFEPNSDDFWVDGYIDHGGELQDFYRYIMSDDSNIIRFLFNQDSFVTTGNDNGDEEMPYNNYDDAQKKGYTVFWKGN